MRRIDKASLLRIIFLYRNKFSFLNFYVKGY
nr:MAG TPA: hypothetical protein [Bacteriophage sp.]